MVERANENVQNFDKNLALHQALHPLKQEVGRPSTKRFSTMSMLRNPSSRFLDTINSNGSSNEHSSDPEMQRNKKNQFIGGPGGWDYTEYAKNKADLDVDISSVDVFSLARHGRLKELTAVLDHGVDPNSKDKNGNTVLMVGAQNGNKAVVKTALRHGALINMTNTVGNTALHFASEFGYEKLRGYLISKGANPDIVNIYGFYAKNGLRVKEPGQ
mmetsp:Transcript_25509/g.34088  ORF Transcript_25509/g.34088 Transcript_25509/m.34088 type:complete len:215 (+) Transcript_25509:71-715(+)